MSSVIAQKTEERTFVEEVAQRYPAFPPGTVVDHERPDFYVEDEHGQRVGIEVRQYSRNEGDHGSRDRLSELGMDALVRSARERFEARHATPLYAHFIPNYILYPPERECRKLGIIAADLIACRLADVPSPPESLVIETAELQQTPLRGFLWYIWLQRRPSGQPGVWDRSNAAPTFDRAGELQRIIDTKNAKVAEYRRAWRDPVWLLIVVKGEPLSYMLQISEDLLETRYRSDFDRVLLYERAEARTVFELQIAPPPAAPDSPI